MTAKNITSLEAYELITTYKDSILVDVRTTVEWENVGVPLLSPEHLILLSWRLFPSMLINLEFEKEIMSKVTNIEKPLFFMCRSGVRSLEAADFCTEIGYTNCYNLIDGFEGNNNKTGWKQNNLPWQVL